MFWAPREGWSPSEDFEKETDVATLLAVAGVVESPAQVTVQSVHSYTYKFAVSSSNFLEVVATDTDIFVRLDALKAKSNCPQLPTELWAEIMSHQDDFTLWVVCRNVCKTLRCEAERIVAKSRLPKLYFKWKAHLGFINYNDHRYIYICTAKAHRLARISHDGNRAYFDIGLKCCLYDQQRLYGEDGMDLLVEPWTDELRERVGKSLVSTDLHRLEVRSERGVSLGVTANDIEILGLEIDLDTKQVSFPWKKFMSDFFADEAYVRKKKLESTMCPTLHELWEFAKRSTSEKLPRWMEFVYDNPCRVSDTQTDRLYEEAFTFRLKEARMRARQTMEIVGPEDSAAAAKKMKILRLKVANMGEARRHQLCFHLLKEAGLWTGIKYTYTDASMLD
jgi:hypothetical protein